MRLPIDARARGLLRRLPLNIAYSLVELALMALLAVQAARLVWAIVTPVGPLGAWQLPPAGVGASAAQLLGGFDPFFRLSGGDKAAPVAVTPLQLALFGVRLNEASGRGSAIIAGADGVQASFAVGEEVAPGVTLKAVHFDHVTLSRGGRDEDLFLDQSAGQTGDPAAPAAGAAAGGEAAAGGQAVTLARLRAEIGFIPRIDAGRVTGLVVRPQGSGQLFRQVGLQNGDVVTQIGGRPVTGASDIDNLAAQYAKGGNIPLSVERGAEVLPIVISVSGA